MSNCNKVVKEESTGSYVFNFLILCHSEHRATKFRRIDERHQTKKSHSILGCLNKVEAFKQSLTFH